MPAPLKHTRPHEWAQEQRQRRLARNRRYLFAAIAILMFFLLAAFAIGLSDLFWAVFR